MKYFYSIKELEYLREIRAKGFKENDPMDDIHTNFYYDFKHNTDIFFDWIEKMEKLNKITELLSGFNYT